jgi:catecholate siderophore receptor
MPHIRSRKHASAPQAFFNRGAALAFAAIAPGAAMAQAAPAAETTLPEIKARAAAENPYKADGVASPKFTQPLVDTPQTITVIKRELIQQQAASTLSEALRNSPGITLLLGENGSTQTGDAVVMRGFDTSASIFVDSIRDLGAISRDMFNIDQVEVVKGPSGADNVRGASSGYINLVTKAPTRRNAASASVMLGSANRVRATADINRTLDVGLPGTAVRLNLMKDEGGVPGRDAVKNRSFGIAPSLTVGLGTPTRFSVFYLHTEARNRPDGGLPTVGLDGFSDAAFATGGALAGKTLAPVDRHNYYGSLDDFNHTLVDMVTTKIEHDFGGSSVLTNTTRLGRSRQTYVIGGLSGTTAADGTSCNRGWFNACDADPSQWTVLRSRQISQRSNQILTNQTNLATEFDTVGLKHNFSGGIEFIHEKQSTPTLASAGTLPVAKLYASSTADAFPAINLAPTGAYSKGSTLTAALYAFDTLAVTERLKLNAGIRWERFSTDFNGVTLATAAVNPTLPVGMPIPSALSLADDLVSLKLGALYKPAPNGSVYVSVANSQLPPGSVAFTLSAAASNANNVAYEPQRGLNLEAGTKWDWFDNRLAVAASIYRSENRNELVQDAIDPNTYTQVGRRRVQGVELSAAGQVTPVWDVNLGLAFMDAKVISGFTGAANPTQDGLLQWTPKVSFTAWTTYKQPFGVAGLTLGGGGRYVGSVVRSSVTQFTTAQSGVTGAPSYWVFDAMASFEVSKALSLQLNLNNLFDKEYIASVNNSGKRYMPGAPRSAYVTANLKF